MSLFIRKTFTTFFIPVLIGTQLAACGGGGGGNGNGDTNTPTPAANQVPRAQNDTVSTLDRAASILIDVLANDSDADGDSLQITSVNTSDQGITPSIANQQVTYNLPPGFIGTDTFEYTISDGIDESTAKVSISIAKGLTISGITPTSSTFGQEIVVHIGDQTYQGTSNQERFTVNVPSPDPNDVIAVTATLRAETTGKPLVLKSYAGWGEKLLNAAIDGEVSEKELPTLYLSAANTAASALIERAAGESILSREQLIEFSQVLPQDLVMESAITMMSLMAGDSWDEFIHPDSFALLEDFPVAVIMAETLMARDPDKYHGYLSSVVDDKNQSTPLSIEPAQELLFIEGPSSIRRPYGFALQFGKESTNTAYLANSLSLKSDNNQISYAHADRTISLNVAGFFPEVNNSQADAICPEGNYGVHYSTAVSQELKKYLDTPVFSAYSLVETHKCVESEQTFSLPPRFYQVNIHHSGDFAPLTAGEFSVSSYADRDENIYLKSSRWKSSVNTPAVNGGFSQRFDFKNGVTDTATVEILSNGRLSIVTGRGDNMEYIPLGMDGAALRTLAVLRREDNSIASMGGDLLVPVMQSEQLLLPAQFNYADSKFSIVDPVSPYHDLGFAFNFMADGSGTDMERFTMAYEANGNPFSWADLESHLEMRYYYDRSTQTYHKDCIGLSSSCSLNRFREFELLYSENGNFYIRVFNETDLTSLYGAEFTPHIFQYSYVDRFKIEP